MKPVTGPDGDNPITDEQIREERAALFADPVNSDQLIGLVSCIDALGRSHRRGMARSAVAAAWNARHGGR